MIGLILDVNGYLMSCADDSALGDAVIEYTKFTNILDEMVNVEDKKVIQPYYNKAKSHLLNILSFRLQANYGVDVIDMLTDIPEEMHLKSKHISIYESVIDLDITDITIGDDYYTHKLNVRINDTYISDFAREKTRDIDNVISINKIKPYNIIDTIKFENNNRNLTEKEYKTIAIKSLGEWECDKLNHIKNPRILDGKLDEVLEEVTKLKNSIVIAIDVSGGVYIVNIELTDGDLLDSGDINYSKYVNEYFIDSDNECHYVNDWDFIQTHKEVEVI